MIGKKIIKLVTKPSKIEGWATYGVVVAQGRNGVIIGGSLGYARDLTLAYAKAKAEAEKGGEVKEERLSRLLVTTLKTAGCDWAYLFSSFGGTHMLATRLCKNALYQLRGGKRLHIHDSLVHGLGGATLSAMYFPDDSNFFSNFLAFAAAGAFFPLKLLEK